MPCSPSTTTGASSRRTTRRRGCFRTPLESLIGRSGNELALTEQEELVERLWSILLAGGTFREEVELLAPDGQRRNISIAGKGNIEPGLHLAILGDITRSKEHELSSRRYELIRERAHDVILFLAMDGRVVETNRAAEETYGYTRDELLKLNVRDLRYDPSDVDKQFRLALKQGVVFETIAQAQGRHDLPGRGRVEAVEARRRRPPQRRPRHHRAARDAGEAPRGRSPHDLRHDRRRSRARDQQSARLRAHEPRGHRTRASASRREDARGGRRRRRARGGRAGARSLPNPCSPSRWKASSASDPSCETSRPSRAPDPVQEVLVDVHHVLDSAINVAQSELRQRARIERSYGEIAPVRGSTSRLGQVFLNLVVNGAQAIPEDREGGGVVRITTSTASDGWACIAIADDGAGMNAGDATTAVRALPHDEARPGHRPRSLHNAEHRRGARGNHRGRQHRRGRNDRLREAAAVRADPRPKTIGCGLLARIMSGVAGVASAAMKHPLPHHPRRRSGRLAALVLTFTVGATGAACGGVQAATQGAKGGTEFHAAPAKPGGPATTAVPAPSAAPLASSTPEGPRPGETIEERATRLHRQAIIVDGHNDIPSVILASNYDIGTKSTRTHTDLARMKAGGITGEFFSIYVEGELAEKPTVARRRRAPSRRRSHRRHVPAGRAPSRGAAPRHDRRRHPARQARGQDRRADGRRGRSRDRELALRAPHALSARLPLHDAHALEHERVGRLGGIQRPARRASSRPLAVRRRGGARDAAHRDARRHLARLRRDVLVGDEDREGARHRVALVVTGRRRSSSQHERRHAARPRQERRRGDGELLVDVPLERVRRRGEEVVREERQGLRRAPRASCATTRSRSATRSRSCARTASRCRRCRSRSSSITSITW